MEDAELLARLVDELDLERDDLEHSVACERCDLRPDSEYGRYRCPDNPAEQRERAAEAADRRRISDLNAYGPPRPRGLVDVLEESYRAQITRDLAVLNGIFGSDEATMKVGPVFKVSKELLADGPVSARPINETTTLMLDETGALDAEQTFGTVIADA